MVVSKRIIALACIFIFCACSKDDKTKENVFSENNPGNKPKDPSSCAASSQAQRIPTQFIVTWEDGRITREIAENATVFEKS